MKIRVRAVRTRYWRPGTDPVREIVAALSGLLMDGDIVAVSEKALSTSLGFVVDESKVIPSSLSRFLASFWVKRVWGGPLGAFTGLRRRTIENLRGYPDDLGARHKQLALERTGLLQALRHYSEGGIDASNLPYALVSLPLPNAAIIAEHVRDALREETGHSVIVMIVDGDFTYSWRNLHVAPRRVQIPGLIHFGGFLSLVTCRALRFRGRPTPVVIAGELINPDRALWLAKVAHRHSGAGAGRTVWGMSERFEAGLTGITYEMLESTPHSPIVVLRLGP